MDDIHTMGIIGAGTMGNGIAHVAARTGHNVVLYDLEQRFLDRAMTTIGKNVDREVAKGKTSTDDKSALMSRIATTVKTERIAEADFVIEAIVEDFEAKSKV